MNKKYFFYYFIIATFLLATFVNGCGQIFQGEDAGEKEIRPQIPEEIKEVEGEEPVLKVYFHEEGEVKEKGMEEYIKGVVAGEMEPDWPDKALSAQAIIARTFTLQKIEEAGKIEEEDAHASTDIEEFQAYSKEDITEDVEKAVNNTRGVVATFNNDYIEAFFHAYAGPRTAMATEGLDHDENPPYITIVESPGKEIVPEDEEKWKLELSEEEIIEAASEVGVEIDQVKSLKKGEKGPSGRVTVLEIGEKEVSAPEFRIAVGSEDMRSTYLEEIEREEDNFKLSGLGFGHGVGMCQWGAKKMALDGAPHEDIMRHFYEGIEIKKIWD